MFGKKKGGGKGAVRGRERGPQGASRLILNEPPQLQLGDRGRRAWNRSSFKGGGADGLRSHELGPNFQQRGNGVVTYGRRWEIWGGSSMLPGGAAEHSAQRVVKRVYSWRRWAKSGKREVGRRAGGGGTGGGEGGTPERGGERDCKATGVQSRGVGCQTTARFSKNTCCVV